MSTGCCRPECNFRVTSFGTVSEAFDTCLLSKQMTPNHRAREMLSDRKSFTTVGGGSLAINVGAVQSSTWASLLC